jgi:FkbM family methyltransferase
MMVIERETSPRAKARSDMFLRWLHSLPAPIQSQVWDLKAHCWPSVEGLVRWVDRSPEPITEWSERVGSVVEVEGIRLRLAPSLSPRMMSNIAGGVHVLSERRLVLPALASDDVVMELGGGIGMLSIACAQRIGSDRVFSYEANPFLESLIRDNYALNSVSPRIRMCMLGPEPGHATFHVARDFWVSSVYRVESEHQIVTVPVEAFNEEVGRIRPTFLIVDIEGAEHELFEYADLNTVNKLMVEFHPELTGAARANALRRQIRRMGFTETTDRGRTFLYRRRNQT